MIPDYAVQQAEMESFLQELKKLVNCGWTYGVIWKIGPDHKTPVWHQSYLNDSLAGTVLGPAQRFESIYRHCQFTPDRPGYAYVAWQRQSPFWWTRLMEPVLTDKNKELFLAQAGIQTIVCFPRRVIPNGTGYCVELACTALVSETEFLRTSIQEFLNTSIDPYISGTTTGPPGMLQDLAPGLDIDLSGPGSAMAALAHQTSAILTDITSQASMGEEEAIEGFGNMLRREENLRQHLEPYLPWTMSSSIHVSSAAAGSNFQTFDGLANYANFHDLSFNYGSPLLPEPFGGPANLQTQPSADWEPSRKGKEIVVEQSDLVLAPDRGNKQSLILPQAGSLNLLQQELLDKLRSPPASAAPPSKSSSPNTLPSGISSGFPLRRPVGNMPPGHCPTSHFQRPHSRHVQSNFPSPVPMKKRQSLIVKWATSLAHRTARIRGDLVLPADRGDLRAAAGGSSFDGSPGTDFFDPRSPNSVAHDHQAAVAHKIAERNRRMKFSHKLQTLISIVPMINKKKDKLSVLTSTIDYIRQLNLRISTLKKEEAAPSTSRMEEGAATTSATGMDREEELTTVFNDVEAGAGPSSSSPVAPVVVVEGSAGNDKWVIKVEANYRPRSLIQLLNVLLELELGVVTVDYGSMNGRFHANISVKNSRNLSRSSRELQAMLCRVLQTSDSPLIGSD